jgi:hypothetical protein
MAHYVPVFSERGLRNAWPDLYRFPNGWGASVMGTPGTSHCQLALAQAVDDHPDRFVVLEQHPLMGRQRVLSDLDDDAVQWLLEAIAALPTCRPRRPSCSMRWE